MRPILMAATSACVLAGCATAPQDCDPTVSRDIISTAACSASGANDTRIAERQSSLKRITLANDALGAQQAELQYRNQNLLGRQAALDDAIRQSQGRINALQAGIAQLESDAVGYAAATQTATYQAGVYGTQTGALVAQTGALDAEAAQLRAEAAQINAQMRQIQAQVSTGGADVDAANRRLAELNREVERLENIVRLRRERRPR